MQVTRTTVPSRATTAKVEFVPRSNKIRIRILPSYLYLACALRPGFGVPCGYVHVACVRSTKDGLEMLGDSDGYYSVREGTVSGDDQRDDWKKKGVLQYEFATAKPVGCVA
jgi:hypothetical protein